MAKMRAVVIGATVAGLLGLPAAAAGLAGGHQTAQRHATTIRWMHFSHMHAADTSFVLVGQVASRVAGHRGALPGAQVKIYRQLDGNKPWVYLGARTTTSGDLPEFRFTTPSRQNAHYKVVYAGDASFAPTSAVTWLSVYRSFNGRIVDGSGAATYKGNVTPYYTHKAISLQRRTCPSCAYRPYKGATTGVGGAFSFALPAPLHGRWWWRVTTPGTSAFIPSYGGTISTELIR